MSGTQSPIDRAAMAIAIVSGKRWVEVGETDRTLYREAARAVFVSLQEPSGLMVDQGVEAITSDGYLNEQHLVAATYVAMMKAALYG